jgi:hypothetical protein
MKVKLLAVILLSVIVFHCTPKVQGQEGPPDFSNKTLMAYAKKAAVLVTDVQPSGDLVLPVNYFHEAFRKEYSVRPVNAAGVIDPAAEPGLMSLTQDDKKLVVCTMLAEAMLTVAKPPDQTSAQYLAAWIAVEPAVLEYKTKKGIPLLDVRIKQAWQQFLVEWREKVLVTDSNRFGDALRQAAYSLVRTGLDIEKEHVDRVLAGTASPAGGSGLGGTSSVLTGSGGSVVVGGYRHVDVHHERMMNGIYRRHDHRMYKIDRIRARR